MRLRESIAGALRWPTRFHRRHRDAPAQPGGATMRRLWDGYTRPDDPFHDALAVARRRMDR